MYIVGKINRMLILGPSATMAHSGRPGICPPEPLTNSGENQRNCVLQKNQYPLLVRQVCFVGADDRDERRALQTADAGTHVEQVLVGRCRFHVGKPQRLELGRAAGAGAVGDLDADAGFLGRFHNSHEVSSFPGAGLPRPELFMKNGLRPDFRLRACTPH